MTNSKRISGFPPVATKDARILILGSMPSVASLEKQQYYGHPRNAFWKIIFSVFGVPYIQDYRERCRFLSDHRIALWDVYASCEREGSLDQDIRDETFNPLIDLIHDLPNLQIILCNGSKSYAAFRKYTKTQGIQIPCLQMVSTSPAAARYTLDQKAEKWTILLKYAGERNNNNYGRICYGCKTDSE